MGGAIKGCVAMYHQSAVVAGVFKKVFAYPDQIILGLIFLRDTGADACVHKKRLFGRKTGGAAFQETQMVGRNCGNRIGVDWPNRPIPCAAHTVRGQRDGPAQFGMQPRMLRLQSRIAPSRVGHKACKEAVVIAFEHHPIAPLSHPLPQVFDHAATVWPAIYQIAQMHDCAMPMQCHIHGNAVVGGFQKVKMAVDVAYGVDVHGSLYG